MKKNTINALRVLSLAGLAVAFGFGVNNVNFTKAEANPLAGTKAEALTAALTEADVEAGFNIYGGSVRMEAPAGMRFLTTVDSATLAMLPQDVTFGTLIYPASMLGAEELLTVDTENVMNGKALVASANENIPADGAGYIITMVGSDLETAFPAERYGESFAVRSYVEYSYMNGETETQAVVYSEQITRTMTYIASEQLAKTPDTNADSLLNQIVTTAVGEDFAIALSTNDLNAAKADEATITVTGNGDCIYTLTSSNPAVAKIENGKVVAVAAGEATISATIGAKTATATVTVYNNPFENPTPIKSKGFTEKDGVFTPEFVDPGWGYAASNWYYFEEMSDTVVFSMDVSLLNAAELVGQFPELNCGRYGITITNGELLKGSHTSYTAPGEYQSSQIALFGQGLCTMYDMYRMKGRDKSAPGLSGYGAKNTVFSAEKDTANLTVVLYKDNLYAYIDGTFTYSWAITSDLLSGTTEGVRTPWVKGDTYKFGIATNGTQWGFNSEIKNVKRFYGADALNEIKTNATYENIGVSATSKNMTASEGVYNAPQGWQSYGYRYTTKTPQTTAIYQVKVTAKNGFIWGSSNSPTAVGITVTNGQLIDEQDYTYIDHWNNATRTTFPDSYYGSCFGLTADRNYLILSGKSMRWQGPAVFATDKVMNADNPSRVLTLVLYQNKLHFYIDSKLMESVAITDTKFQPTNAQKSGKTYAYKEGDGFLFGISSYNLADGTQAEGAAKDTPATFSDIVELYGDEALLELQTNDTYSKVGANVNTLNMKTNADGSFTPSATGWMSYSYKYTSPKFTNTAVYQVKFTTTGGLIANSWSGNAGIIVTNGNFIQEADVSYKDYNGHNRSGGQSLTTSMYYGSNFSFDAHNGYSVISGKSMGYYAVKTTDYALDASNVERTMTVVLYNDTFYVYIDGVHFKTYAVDANETKAIFAQNSGSTYGFAKGDSFRFGVSTFNVEATSGLTMKVTQELYGAEALEEIKATYSGQITVA